MDIMVPQSNIDYSFDHLCVVSYVKSRCDLAKISDVFQIEEPPMFYGLDAQSELTLFSFAYEVCHDSNDVINRGSVRCGIRCNLISVAFFF